MLSCFGMGYLKTNRIYLTITGVITLMLNVDVEACYWQDNPYLQKAKGYLYRLPIVSIL